MRCDYSDLPSEQCAHCSAKAELVFGDQALEALVIHPPSREGFPVSRELGSGKLFAPRVVVMPGWGEPCLRCSALAGESFLCPRCVEQLEVDCANVPALVEQLEVTITRLDRVFRPSPPADAEATEPMPYGVAASQSKDELRWALVTGALAVLHRLGQEWAGRDSSEDVAAWLGAHSMSVALHPEADAIAVQVRDAVAKAMRAIDTLPERVLAGPCPTCDSRLMAFKGSASVWCDTCGRRHKVAEVREPMRAKLADLQYTLSGLRDVARSMGIKCDTNRVNKLAQRGRITQVGESIDGYALYRVGDFLAEIDRQEGVDIPLA